MSDEFISRIFNKTAAVINNSVSTLFNKLCGNNIENHQNDNDKQSIFVSYQKNQENIKTFKDDKDNDTITALLYKFKNFDNTPLLSDSCQTVEEEYSLTERKPANAKIDNDFSQGQMNDCVFLAGVYSLLQSKNTAKIVNDSIELKKDEKGNIEGYNITFRGLNETYYISQSDVDKAAAQFIENGNDTTLKTRSYSYGDDDMTAFELAFEKACIYSNNDDFKKYVNLVQNKYTVSSRKPYDEIDRLYAVNENSLLYALGLPNSDIVTLNNQYSEFINKDTVFVETNDGKKYYYAGDTKTKPVKDVNNKPIELSGQYVVKEQNETEVVLEKNYFMFFKEKKVIPIDEIVALEQFYSSDLYRVDDLLNDYQKNKSGLFIIDCFNDKKNPKNDDFCIHVNDINGKDTELLKSHAYALKDVDDDSVTLVNPHDTSQEIKLSRKELYGIQSFQIRYANCKDS